MNLAFSRSRYSCALVRWGLLVGTLFVVADSAFAQTVAAGLNHTVILKSDGTVWTVGADNFGQLGEAVAVCEVSSVDWGPSIVSSE